MAKYRMKTEAVDAIQFKYRGDCDGPEACVLATTLGLSRNGPSKLWEIRTPYGWHIVEYGFWVIIYADGTKAVFSADFFEDTFEPIEEEKIKEIK